MSDFDRRANVLSRRLSRRGFIKVAAAIGLLAGCRPVRPPHRPQPTPTNTPQSEDLSRVIHVHHPDVWYDEHLVPDVVRQMLDASVVALTGLGDAGEAWASLFRPSERVCIKVNTIASSGVWSHMILAVTVSECLKDAGVPANHITIFDRRTNELENAGFSINESGPGVRCYGSGLNYTGGYSIMDTDIRLSDILLDCDALINLPVLKYHGHAGMTFAMKNHFGSFDRPRSFHRPRTGQAMAELNAVAPIRDRTRLVIGDTFSICPSPNWQQAMNTSSFLMSRDSVAHDTVGLQLLSQVMSAQNLEPASATDLADEWLATCSRLGLGTNDLERIETVRVDLGT